MTLNFPESNNKQNDKIYELRKALRFVWDQNLSKADRIRNLAEEKQNLINHKETEHVLKTKILEKQISTITSDLNFSGRKYEELLEKWNRSQKDLSKFIRRFKIAQTLSILFFLGTSVFIWLTYRANAIIKDNTSNISILEFTNNDLLIKKIALENKIISSDQKLKKDHELKVKTLTEKNNAIQSNEKQLKEDASYNLNEFHNSITELKHEYSFKLNLMRNEYSNTIELLTAKVSVANDTINKLESKNRKIILITKIPEKKTVLESNKTNLFLKNLKAFEIPTKKQTEKTSPLKPNALTEYLRKLGATVINNESSSSTQSDTTKREPEQKF